MARPDIVRGTYVNILVSDGATPAVFTPLCGITARDLTDQINTQDAFVRDCAIPDDAPTRSVIATGRQWDVTGTGYINRALLSLLEDLMGKIEEYRFELGEPADDKVYGGYWSGDGMLTQKKVGGDDGDFATLDITIASDGPWVFTEVP